MNSFPPNPTHLVMPIHHHHQAFHPFPPPPPPPPRSLYPSNLHQVPSHHTFQFNRSHPLNSSHSNHHPPHSFLRNSIPSQSPPFPPPFSAYLEHHSQFLSSALLHQARSPTSSNRSHPPHHHQTPQFHQSSKPKTPTHQSNLRLPTLHTSSPLITPSNIITHRTRTKFKIRLPLEFTPDHQLSLDESRIRSKWKRQPISIQFDLLNSSNQFKDDLFQSTSKDQWPQRLGNRLPDSIDVYLPGQEVWDDYRTEILDEKLNELGYHSIQQDHHLVHLDLRLRLEAYLSDHPEPTFQIPTIPGIYPFALPPSPISPISKPLMSFTAPVLAPRGHSSTMSIALPGGTPNQYLTSNRSPTFGPPSTPVEPIGPGLKPTAPVFKPTGPLIPTAPEFRPTWAPAPVPISIRPRGSISPHRMLPSPTLMIVGEEEEEEELKRQSEAGEIVTDSEPETNQQEVLTDSEAKDDQEEGEIEESMMRNEVTEDDYSGPDSVEEQVMNEHNHLMRSSISSQALRRISFNPIISDSQPVMKPRSSGEEEDDIPLAKLKDQRFSNQVHHLDHSSQTSSLPTGVHITQDQRSEYTNPSDEDELEASRTDRHPSSVSLPNHCTSRSHTFGINSFSVSGRSSMTAGDGVPHNWINGVEDEDDIISNPSDEAQDWIQNEEDHMYRTNPEATRFTIAEDEEVSKPNLNAFAAEFKPNFTFSSMIPHIGSLSKQVEDDEHQLIGSPGRGIKRQKTQQEVWIEEEGPLIPSSSTFCKFASSSTDDQFYQPDQKDKSSTPTPPAIEEDVSFERPGKDNMRTFKFPYTKNPNESSFTEHTTHSISSPLSNSKPHRSEQLPTLRPSVSLLPPFSLPELPELLAASSSGIASDSIREDLNHEHYKTLPHNLGSIMIPNSPLIYDRLLPIMRDQPITPKVTRLRPSSSFDDESSSSVEHHSRPSSPSPSRSLNQPRSFELIPTQNTSSKDSMISLNQLKQQKIEWSQIHHQGNVNANVKMESGEIVKMSSSASKKRGEIPKFLDHDLECISPVGQVRRIEKLSIGPKIVVGEKSGGIEETRFLDMAGLSTIRISNRVALEDDEDAEGEEEEEDEEMQSGSSSEDEVEEGDVSIRSTTKYINKLFNKKFKELRQDLSGLHSLKVDFDSLKRDALLEEMQKRMEMVIEESQRKSKGNETEIILRAIKEEKKTEEEIEVMMMKLSEAVKPQIYQLIDLTSDKSETAGLIVQELKPSLEDLIKTSLSELKVEKEKERTDEEGNRESFKVGEEMIELMTQLDIKSLNFYQDISQQIGNTTHEISELIKSEIAKEVIERQSNEIQELKQIKSELELGLLKARSDHGRVRSERAVEKEKMMEEKSKVERELEDLKTKKRNDELEIERFKKCEEELKESRKVEVVQKEKVERERDELKELIKRLESRCEGFEVKEMEWETKRILQTEEIAELKIKNRMIESTNKSNERRLELSQDGYDKLQEVRNLDLIRYQTKEDEIRNEIRNKEIEFNCKIKENEREIREAIEGKALVVGEVRSLEGRIHKLDEQISGLKEMNAAKQQSLANVNQRLYESERKSKEVESLRNEMNQIKTENRRLIRIEEDVNFIEKEKIRIEDENCELLKESESVKIELEKMYESVGKELEEVYVKLHKLEEENKLIKIEKEELEKEKLDKEKLEREKLEREKLEREKEKEDLIRFEGNSNSTYNKSNTPKKFYPTPPLESYDFIKSNVPLSNSIHAPKPHDPPNSSQGRERYDEDDLDSNEGTVKSFGVGVTSGNSNKRAVSPAFSRASSRAIMDHDGWWSVE